MFGRIRRAVAISGAAAFGLGLGIGVIGIAAAPSGAESAPQVAHPTQVTTVKWCPAPAVWGTPGLTNAGWNSLVEQGWSGSPYDGQETLYAPGCNPDPASNN
jgi:hypothetical protein